MFTFVIYDSSKVINLKLELGFLTISRLIVSEIQNYLSFLMSFYLFRFKDPIFFLFLDCLTQDYIFVSCFVRFGSESCNANDVIIS